MNRVAAVGWRRARDLFSKSLISRRGDISSLVGRANEGKTCLKTQKAYRSGGGARMSRMSRMTGGMAGGSVEEAPYREGGDVLTRYKRNHRCILDVGEGSRSGGGGLGQIK